VRVRATGDERWWLAHVVAILFLIAVATAFIAVSSRGAAREPSRVVDVRHFGFPPSSSGRYVVTTVPTAHGEPSDLDAMRLSQKSAIVAAMRCTGTAGALGLAPAANGIGGPSAGLMFALTLVDHLDRRDLARERLVAGTGAIRPDGAVLPVGAVAEKVKAGADLFLVPDVQTGEAAAAASDLEVIGVGSVDEAVEALSGTGCAPSTRRRG